MDKNDLAYWQGKEPKNTEELRREILSAVRASEQWLDAANIPDEQDRVMIYAQIFWLKQLLKISRVDLKEKK